MAACGQRRGICGRCLMLAVLLAGCSSGGGTQAYTHQEESNSESVFGSRESAPSDITGVWQGTTYVNSCFAAQPGRCGAQQIVIITLRESERGKGSYRCSYGNQTCLGQNDTGRIIEASLNHRQMMIRVAMPDGTACIFTGHLQDSSVNGGYSCYAGAGILEQGSWRARHLY